MIDKKDMKNVDNFAIWKIESGILLKKYEMNIVKGKMMHKPVKVVCMVNSYIYSVRPSVCLSHKILSAL